VAVLPFERQPGETDAAWAAFEVYRDLPASGRSVDAAWRTAKGRKTRPPQHWREWSRNYSWADRAADWDREVDEEARQANLRLIVEARKRQAGVLQATQRTLAAPIIELLDRLAKKKIDMAAIDHGTLYRLAIAAAPLLPRLGEAELALLGEPASAPLEFAGEPVPLRTDLERAAAVAAALEEAEVLPGRGDFVESTAEVRELPRRAAG
jgi:hypothetical protein